jgi:phenylpyruvate tautomerase PptA (4-oxalocrotonate tautomerase family)
MAMPLVRIDTLGANRDRLDSLGRAVHQAMIETIGIPPDDLFQVLTGHDGASSTMNYDPGYLGVHRDNGVVFIAITMRSGRTHAQKQALFRRIAELAHEQANTDPHNVFVTLTENEAIDWSFGNGIAQYAPTPD